ncbi:MAG: S8 family serine peptidase, partial [Actinomycetota bacterium]
MTRSTFRPRRGAPLPVVVIALAAAGAASAAPAREDGVLVKLDPGATREERAAVWSALGATASRGLPAGWRAYRLPREVSLADARARLRSTSADVAVQLDRTIVPFALTDDPELTAGNQYGLSAIRAPEAWEVPHTRPPVTVAVVDTGAQVLHTDLRNGIWRNVAEVDGNGLDDDGDGYVDDVEGWDVANGNASVFDSPSDDAHGTHVAGIIGAEAGNGVGIAGVAGPPGRVRIMPVKFLTADGGRESDAIAAIDYARRRGARVINASWGGPPSDALCDAVQTAVNAGVVVVAAAGNDSVDNDATPTVPSGCPGDGVISVAATTATDGLASFSNFGATTVDVGAPGDDVRSTLPFNAYGDASGTSMAAPHVAAVAALMVGQDPTLTPALVREGVMGCGDPVAALTGRTVSGRRLNAVNAVEQARSRGAGVDAVAPCAFAASSPDPGVTTGPRPMFMWGAATDLGSGVASYRVLLDGAVVAQAARTAVSTQPPADLPEGTHTWTVEAVDGAGNRRATAPRTVVVDGGPPAASPLVEPAADAAVRVRQPVLRWGATVDTGVGLGGYRLVVDGAAGPLLPPDVLSATPAVALPDGPHTWEVAAVDRLAQERRGEARRVVIDAT